MNKLQLITTKTFNGQELDCYAPPEQQDKSAFWATREQIGTLLEYENPEPSVKNLHRRHRERLDEFSTSTKLIRVEGGRMVTREVTVYNFKGLLSICRYSNKPRADAVMDWLFEVADEIRRIGCSSIVQNTPSQLWDAAESIIRLAFDCSEAKDFIEVIALDNVFKKIYGRSALDLAGLEVVEHIKYLPRFSPSGDMYKERLSSHFELEHYFIWNTREIEPR